MANATLMQAPTGAVEPSRLVRVLAELGAADAALPASAVAERLGELVDFASSISLSSVLAGPAAPASESAPQDGREVRDEFLRRRQLIVRSVVESFAPSPTAVRVRLPEPERLPPEDAAGAWEPYRRFYAALQRDVDYRTRKLHSFLLDALVGLSPELARLAQLDTVVGEILAARSRRLFGQVPALLARRFAALCAQHRAGDGGDALAAQGWARAHERFTSEMRGLLLAEMEARLQPSLGLFEAIDDQLEVAPPP